MKRQASTDQTVPHAGATDETYPLLVTGRVEPSPAANGHDAPAETARRNERSEAGHGSVYLPRYRFGTGWRRRRTPLVAA